MRRVASTEHIEAAARAAAAEDGVSPKPSAASSVSSAAASGAATATDSKSEVAEADVKEDKKKSKSNGLRRGKWTVEEEAYANRLIQEFKSGLLPLTDGTTLRTFLSKLLNCDPMRISKKFVGQNCIGKQVFRRRQADMDKLSPEEIERSRRELAELERRFLERVAQSTRIKGSGGKASSGSAGNGASSTPGVGSVKPDPSAQVNGSSLLRKQDLGPRNMVMNGGQAPMIAPWMMPPQVPFGQPKMIHGNPIMYPFAGGPQGNAPNPLAFANPQPSYYGRMSASQARPAVPAIPPAKNVSKQGADGAKPKPGKLNGVSDAQRKRLAQNPPLNPDLLPTRGILHGASVPRNEAENEEEETGESGGDEARNTTTEGMEAPNFVPRSNGQKGSTSNMNRTTSVDVLTSMELPSMGLPSVQSMENLAALGRMFSSNNNLQGLANDSSNSLSSYGGGLRRGQPSSSSLSQNGRNNSVDDFLSLVANGDIPEVDQNHLSLPIFQQLQRQPGPGMSTSEATSSHAQAQVNYAKQSHALAQNLMREEGRPGPKRMKYSE